MIKLTTCECRTVQLSINAKITSSMEGSAEHPAPRGWKTLPIALWVYFAALIISVVVAIEFSTLTFHFTAFNITIYAVLLAGLLTGSRLCRRLLMFLTALAAYGLLVIQIGAFDFGDLLLVVLALAQLTLLCTPSARAFASDH